jgi:glucose/arabinose dehydrogenase
VKTVSLRLAIGLLFALIGIFLSLFANARPLNGSAIRWMNDVTDRPNGPFPTIQLQQVASSFASPVTVTNAGDGSSRLFIVQQTGEIRILINGTVLPTPFLDIHELISCCGEQGLLGLAFHPDYGSNGFFYVYYTDLAGDIAIARYTVSQGDPNVADPESHYPILSQVHQPFSNHNGGQIAFGPDRYLYAGLGDGGGSGDPQENGQNLGTWLAKILRVDINGDDFPGDPTRNYAVPPDNPFVGIPNALDEIWAYGVRNPWRFSFDRGTGDLLIGDVGQSSWEEIDFQPASSPGGENYGWDVLEGMHCFEDVPLGSCNDFLNGGSTLPVLEYSHGFGCSVTGGYRYRGVLYPSLRGIYFYADLCSGRIWGAIRQHGGTWLGQQLLDTQLTVTTFGEDEAGELYVADYSVGVLYKVIGEQPTPTPTPTVTPTAAPTGTVTPSPTSTPTATATASPTPSPRPTPTPRFRATPRPRPSPPPRPGAR